jgi:predicted ATP-dependent serine protease
LALAIAYARYIQCNQPTENDACGKCPSCLKYNKLQHPDLHFIYPVAKKGNHPNRMRMKAVKKAAMSLQASTLSKNGENLY